MRPAFSVPGLKTQSSLVLASDVGVNRRPLRHLDATRLRRLRSDVTLSAATSAVSARKGL
jgi:hypothetical protein